MTTTTTTIKLLMVAIVLSVATFFSNIYFPKQSNEVLAKRAIHKQFKAERDLLREQIFKEHYDLMLLEQKAFIAYNDLNQAKDNQRIFSFPNKQYFVTWLSLSFVILLTSLRLFSISSKLPEKEQKGNYLFSCAVFSVGIYLMIWIFYPAPDLPKEVYTTVLIGTSILSSFLVFSVFKYSKSVYESMRKIYQLKIRKLIWFSLEDGAKYIPDMHLKNYQNDVLNVIDEVSK